MKTMEKKSQTNKKNVQKDGENAKKNWYLLPILKSEIIKRTETYVLFKCGEGATAIINAHFLRKKEHEDCIFASVPEDFVVTIRWKEYKEGSGWQTKEEMQVQAEQFAIGLRLYNNRVLDEVPADDLPF